MFYNCVDSSGARRSGTTYLHVLSTSVSMDNQGRSCRNNFSNLAGLVAV